MKRARAGLGVRLLDHLVVAFPLTVQHPVVVYLLTKHLEMGHPAMEPLIVAQLVIISNDLFLLVFHNDFYDLYDIIVLFPTKISIDIDVYV